MSEATCRAAPSSDSGQASLGKKVDIELRALRNEDAEAFRLALGEFERVNPEWPFAFHFDESLPFTDYVERLRQWSRGNDLPEGWVPNTFLVGVAGGVIVGRVSIRHALNDFLERTGGHIGFGVVPSHRRRGYATAMLERALSFAAKLEIPRVLLTCDADNTASRRVIEGGGGVLEKIVRGPDLDVPQRRYWITVSRWSPSG